MGAKFNLPLTKGKFFWEGEKRICFLSQFLSRFSYIPTWQNYVELQRYDVKNILLRHSKI